MLFCVCLHCWDHTNPTVLAMPLRFALLYKKCELLSCSCLYSSDLLTNISSKARFYRCALCKLQQIPSGQFLAEKEVSVHRIVRWLKTENWQFVGLHACNVASKHYVIYKWLFMTHVDTELKIVLHSWEIFMHGKTSMITCLCHWLLT